MPNITYKANVAFDQATDTTECVITRDIAAGISGPDAEFPIESVEVDTLDLELAAHGYTRTDRWTMVPSCQGLTLVAPVTPN